MATLLGDPLFVYGKNRVNSAPKITTLLHNLEATVGKNFQQQFSTIDADYDNVTFTLVDMPSNATFDGNLLSWTPTWQQAGSTDTMTIIATDEAGNTFIESFKIYVSYIESGQFTSLEGWSELGNASHYLRNNVWMIGRPVYTLKTDNNWGGFEQLIQLNPYKIYELIFWIDNDLIQPENARLEIPEVGINIPLTTANLNQGEYYGFYCGVTTFVLGSSDEVTLSFYAGGPNTLTSGEIVFTGLRIIEADSVELSNGNFESGSNNQPDSWTFEAFNNVANFQWETGTGRNNSHCVSIDIPSDQLDDARWIQDVYLLPNKTYKLSGWIKGENITLVQGSIGANICLMGGFVHSPSFSGTFDWQKTEFEFETPADGIVTIACRLGFYGSILHGKAWFDDLSLTLLDSTFHLTGSVEYDHTSDPISDAEILIDNQSVCTTNSSGQFTVSDVTVGEHTISVVKQATDGTAISGADVLAVMKQLAFLITLSDDQKIAADVTKDGEISGADVQAMMRFLAFFTTNTAYTGEWRFFPEDTTIYFSEDTNLDFKGYLLGDVNLSWTNTALLARNRQNESIYDLKFGAPIHSETEEISIPLILNTSDEKMNTLLFSMIYPASTLKFKRIEWTQNLNGFQSVINSEEEGELHLAIAGLAGICCNGKIAYLIFEKMSTQKSPIELQFTRAIANDTELKDLPILILDRNLANVPKQFKLFQNYPNPFNAETVIKYQLPRDAHVKLAIYNSLGQKIKTLADKNQNAGIYSISWNGKNDDGRMIVSGIYLVRFEAGSFTENRKLILLK